MKFSVVIPTYNRADLLDRCLQSLVDQTYTDFEVLVCDDGSMDNSRQITEAYSGKLSIKYMWSENWGGPARPRNCGIAASIGEWICFLDSDDWWVPNKLELCLPYLNDYDFVYHTLQMVSQNDGVLDGAFCGGRVPKSPAFLDLLRKGNCCANSSVVIRKSIVDKVGMVSEDRSLIAVEDFDYCIRISQHTDRFFFIDQVLGFYWLGDTSITSVDKHIQRHEALYEKHLQTIKESRLRRSIFTEREYRNGRYCTKYGKYAQSLPHYKAAQKSKRIDIKLKSYIYYYINKAKNR